MKLRSIISTVAATVAVGAMATDYTAGNTFARLPVTANYASTIVALPFSGCGMAEGSIYVTNLVMTTNLDEGDTLMHFNGTTWDAWEIDDKGKWRGLNTSTTAGGLAVTAPASEVAINCGEACWLTRKTPSNKFYLYGQVNAAKTDVTVKSSASKVLYTIVGCPYEAGDFDITGITGAAPGDTIQCMANNEKGYVEYLYTNSNWCAAQTTVTSSKLPAVLGGGETAVTNTTWTAISAGTVRVPAGCGFMYGRAKNAGNLSITWGD